jgi:DNA-binding transcriptional regulator YdaS (Cro superfamily)
MAPALLVQQLLLLLLLLLQAQVRRLPGGCCDQAGGDQAAVRSAVAHLLGIHPLIHTQACAIRRQPAAAPQQQQHLTVSNRGHLRCHDARHILAGWCCALASCQTGTL